MKKFLAVIVVLLLAAAAFVQFAVPRALTNYLKDKVVTFTHAKEVQLSLDALPSAKMALGYIDKIHCEADTSIIGELELKKAVLSGTAIHINIMELLMPTDGISREEHTNRVLQHADSLELSGIITAESLRDFLAERTNDQLKNLDVTMTPEGILASAKVKILGREADVQIGGKIIARDGDLYFSMNQVNLENAILKRVNLDKFLGDFNLTERVKMPFGLQFREVEMRQGETFVKSTRN
ncbi:MAG: LmeA family phospholipid-binding protein [Quinella sp. 3Q1]|nr:LmeA family phospholipid-binding protein [Quinella sp. 3Q1]MBR6887903.1 LmeA family phospholipid-binding protein [Selenomonadaceae bacterium]